MDALSTRILIIEDDPALAANLHACLEREGYLVTLEDTGQAGIDHARAHNPHLVLLNVRLPDLSGFDVCRQMRQFGLRQPIITLTARLDETGNVLRRIRYPNQWRNQMEAPKSFGTMGKAVYPLEGSREAELFVREGSGSLTHMWFGADSPGHDRLWIRVYVDGEDMPSIDMELFMGHGIGFADDTAPWGTRRIGKTGSPSGIYNTYRIPFGQSVRVTAQLPEGQAGNPRFWYIIRGEDPVVFL